MCPPVNRLGIYIGHMSATSLRLAVRINGHVQPTCAVKVDTLLTEEKARAKLINEAKLKFGIMMIIIDVSGVRLYASTCSLTWHVACSLTWHVAQHGTECRLVVDRTPHRTLLSSNFWAVWMWGRGYPPPKLAAAGGPRGGSEAQVGPFGQGRG